MGDIRKHVYGKPCQRVCEFSPQMFTGQQPVIVAGVLKLFVHAKNDTYEMNVYEHVTTANVDDDKRLLQYSAHAEKKEKTTTELLEFIQTVFMHTRTTCYNSIEQMTQLLV